MQTDVLHGRSTRPTECNGKRGENGPVPILDEPHVDSTHDNRTDTPPTETWD